MSDDRELAAMQAVAESFADLPRDACDRIIKWADARYVKLSILDGDVEGLTRFVDGIAEAAREIGDVRPLDILTFAQQVVEAKRGQEAKA